MFEWDPKKNHVNQKKHGVNFADTFAVFEDPAAMTIDDPTENEERYITMGMDAYGRILVVVYTWREETIRIISARKAGKAEAKQYESQI